MEVREMGDAQSVELGREAGERHLEDAQPDPTRLEEPPDRHGGGNRRHRDGHDGHRRHPADRSGVDKRPNDHTPKCRNTVG